MKNPKSRVFFTTVNIMYLLSFLFLVIMFGCWMHTFPGAGYTNVVVLTTAIVFIFVFVVFAYFFRLILAHEKQREDREHENEMELKRNEVFKAPKKPKELEERLQTIVGMIKELSDMSKEKEVEKTTSGKVENQEIEERTNEKPGKAAKAQIAETLKKLNARIDKLSQKDIES